MSMWDDIINFHVKFEVPQSELPTMEGNDEMLQYRIKFLREELKEFEDAVASGHDVEAFDALLDLVYVAMGTAYVCNFPWDEGWEHVQEANMLKQRVKSADESKRGSKYDVVKPDGWVAPNQALQAVLLFQTFETRMARLKEKLS